MVSIMNMMNGYAQMNMNPAAAAALINSNNQTTTKSTQLQQQQNFNSSTNLWSTTTPFGNVSTNESIILNFFLFDLKKSIKNNIIRKRT